MITTSNLKEKVDCSVFCEAIPGIYAVMLPDAPTYTIVAVSDDFLKLRGLPKEEIIGKSLFEIYPETDQNKIETGAARLRAAFEKVATQKKEILLPAERYDVPDATEKFGEHYWQTCIKPVLNETGDVVFIIKSAINVTAKILGNKREGQFKPIQQAYNLLIQAPTIIGIIKKENYIIDLANDGLLKLWHKGPEVVGKPLFEVLPQLQDQFKPILDEVLQTGNPFSASESSADFTREDGKEETVFFNYAYQPFYNEDGEIEGVFATGVDVTEQVLARKQVEKSEQRFRNIMEQAPDPILIFKGEEMVVEVANKPLLQLWNVGEDVIGKPFLEILPEMKEQPFIDLLRDVYFNGVTHYGHEIPAVFQRSPDFAETVFVNFSYAPYREKDGTVSGVIVLATNVTDHVNAKKGIEEVQKNLRNMIMQSPVAMGIMVGPTYIVQVANEKILEIWGRTAEQIIGKPVFEVIPEAVEQGFDKLLEQVYKTGNTYKAFEVPLFLIRGGKEELIYVDFVYEAMREADGSISGVMAVAADVTERVTIKKQIEQSKEELNLAIQAADLGSFKVDVAENKGIFSERIREWFGFDTYEKNMNEIYEVIHKEDRKKAIAGIEASLKNEELSRHNIYYKIINKLTGEEKHLRSFGKTIFNDKGKAVSIFGVIQDVTQQMLYQNQIKENEILLQQKVQERTADLERQTNLLNNILQYSSNGISVSEVIRNEEGKVIDAISIVANDAAIRITGLPKEDYLSKRATEIDPNILESDLFKKSVKTLETGESFITQYALNNVWLEITTSKMDDDHLINIFTDVTPIVASRLQLEKTVEDLKRSNQNLEEFAYAASHDLKEPVRKIHFFSDRLKGSLGDRITKDEVNIFERMEMASKRMGSLIDDLLTYSQVSFTSRDLEKVDLNEVINMVLTDLDLEIEEKEAKIEVEKLFVVEGQTRQLQQAFQNLISNALKYKKPGVPPQIQIKTCEVNGSETDLFVTSEDQQKKFNCVSIEDNGVGFQQEDAERIFNVFTRLHGNSEYRGTGVGLSIVRKVMENHSAYVTANSEVGKGSTFLLYFPVQ